MRTSSAPPAPFEGDALGPRRRKHSEPVLDATATVTGAHQSLGDSALYAAVTASASFGSLHATHAPSLFPALSSDAASTPASPSGNAYLNVPSVSRYVSTTRSFGPPASIPSSPLPSSMRTSLSSPLWVMTATWGAPGPWTSSSGGGRE